MAEAKETQPQEPKFMYRYTSEDGTDNEVDAQTFSDQGKTAYQKIADLGKRKAELQSALTEVEVLTNFYNQVIQQTDINPPEENGEDTSVDMEKAHEIAEEAEQDSQWQG